jgi:uncharacterized MAPEG superfamily protein
MHMYLANLAAKPIVALLAFAAWTLTLALAVVGSRIVLVLTGEKRPTDFPSGTPHGSDLYWRLNRAHANAFENLPIFAAIVLGGAALGVSSPRLATLALVVVGARIVQSCLHVTSGKAFVIVLRMTAFLTQLVCFAWMIVETLSLAAA